MKRNTKIALLIAVGFFLTLIIVLLFLDQEFQQTGKSVSLKWEFQSDEIADLKAENSIIIEELTAVNKDLTQQSVMNHRIQIEADSIISKKDKLIQYQQNQIRNRDEKIDSLHAVINSIRQSDI